MLIVTHDLGVVASYCSRVLVMYRGNIVEQGLVDDVFVRPQHPYTISLLNSVVRPEDEAQYVPGSAETPDSAELETEDPSEVQLSEARRS